MNKDNFDYKTVFCCELKPRTKIRITKKSNGEKQDYTVKELITLQYFKDKPLAIHDVEVILCRKTNKYFRYHMYLNGESWVKEIEILNTRRARIINE